MPAALRDERLANVRGPQRDRGEIHISRPDDIAMVQALIARVSAWLQVPLNVQGFQRVSGLNVPTMGACMCTAHCASTE